MLIGTAFQSGLIPLELQPLRIALKQMVKRSNLKQNINAFEVGRYLAVYEIDESQLLQSVYDTHKETYKKTLQEKYQILSGKFRGRHLSTRYTNLVERTVEKLNLDDQTNRCLALYVYDLIQFENINYAELYIDKIMHIFENDSGDYEATKASIKYLHKVMVIKDEVYVSHLLTSKEKLARDKIRYNVDEKNGDRIKYLHLNRPHFTVMGIDIEYDMDTRNWMLLYHEKNEIPKKMAIKMACKRTGIQRMVYQRSYRHIQSG